MGHLWLSYHTLTPFSFDKSSLSRQSRQFLPHRLHQRLERLGRKIESNPRRGEEFRQRPGAAEGEGGAVVGEGLLGVLLGFEPELQGAELGDAVFDVIERDVEQVELALPTGGAGGFVAGPVDAAAEAVEEGEPMGGALAFGVAGGGGAPGLEAD